MIAIPNARGRMAGNSSISMSRRLICLRLAVVVITLQVVHPAGAQLPGYRWATGIGGEEDDTTMALVVDSSGVCFITGYCAGVAEFPGTTPLICRGLSDAFVARFDVAGRAVWAVRFGGTNVDIGQAITLDSSGNVLVAGYFAGDADFGNTNLVGFGRDDCFTAKLSANGQVLWVRQAGGTNVDRGAGIATDASGELLVTGSFRNSASFGATNLTSRGQSDIFIAKYDSGGELLWVRQGGGPGVDEGKAVAVGTRGDIWVTGFFGDVGTFDDTNALARGLGDFFVARYSADGSLVWVRTAGGTNNLTSDTGDAIAVDSDGNCYVSGTFHGNGQIGSVEVQAGNSSAIFLAKYSPSGELLWARASPTTSGGIGLDLAIDRRGTILMSGIFVGNATFSGVRRSSSSGQAESFLAAYAPAGELLWFSQSGGSAYNGANGLGVDDEGRAYTGGWYRSGTSFGGIQVSNRISGRNAYIARIDGLPWLKAAAAGTNLVLSWTVYATNFQLQSSPILPATTWGAVTDVVSLQAEQRTVTKSIAENARYYRLIRQ